MNLCKCGCGKLIVNNNNTFIQGHNASMIRRKKLPREIRICLNCQIKFESKIKSSRKFCSQKCYLKWKIKDNKIKESILCVCGCGKYTKPGNSHIHGHATKEEKIKKVIKMKATIQKSKGFYEKIGAKISKSKMGSTQSNETKEKIRNHFLGKTIEELYGKEKADVMRTKNSESKRGKIPQNLLHNIKCNNSYRQLEMYEVIKKYFPTAISTYRVKTQTCRYLDVAIPESKLDFEYNGKVHLMKNVQENDTLRLKELTDLGWKVIIIDRNNFKDLDNIIRLELERDRDKNE